MEDMLRILLIVLAVVLAGGIAAGMKCRNHHRRLRQELNHVNQLLDASIKLNAMMHNPELLLTQVMLTASEVIDAEAASIILKDEVRGDLYFKTATGEKGSEVKEIRLQLGEGIAGWVAKHGRPLKVDEVMQDARWSSRVAAKTNFVTRNMICVPIKTAAGVIGVLQAVNKRGATRFSEQDIKLLEAITLPTGVAIENARLYEKLAAASAPDLQRGREAAVPTEAGSA